MWDFVNSIVPFNRYTNSPIANYHGKLYNLPFNMNTFHQMWGVTTPEEAMAKIDEQRAEARKSLSPTLPSREGEKSPSTGGVGEARNLEEQALALVGRDIYETLIKEYTEKQWGRKCTDLPAFIIKRLPVRLVFENNYFNDSFQGIPIGGYNKLIDGLLDGTETMTGVDFFNSEFHDWSRYANKLVYTGQIDQYFQYKFGKLDWRTVFFKTRVENTPNMQGNAVVNYTSHDVPFTRIIEHKHFEMFGQQVYDNPKTVVSEEYSMEYRDGMEPYYPVNDTANNLIADKYRAAAAIERGVLFGGRLAEYRYYDMAPVIEKVMKMQSF